MKKEILISVPKNWSAITLRQYIELQKDLKAYEGESIYPNLSKIEYGAYIDISKLVTKEMGEDWAKAMAILYRPITKQKGKLYEVANYTGEEEWEWFLDLGMDIHWGAYYFFFYLSMELLSAIPNSMMKMVEETLPNIKSILEENGVTIPQS